MKSKSELRSELRARRAKMALPDAIDKSQLIMKGVMTILQNLTFKSLHCYEPITKLHEVDVSELFDLPEVLLYTSRLLDNVWHVVSMNDDIAKDDPLIDVIIVPMLGFDEHLHRIGYGGGYYDRLLAKYPRALKIGVCYENGRCGAISTEPHDIALDIIVTDVSALIAV